MENLNSSALPAETREWLEKKAAAGGYASPGELVQEVILKLHDLDRLQEAAIESKLLERLQAPVSEMTDEDWQNLRKDLRARHAARAQ